MAIQYRIDDGRRIVLAEGRGSVTDEDVFGYQRDVWSRSEVAAYDELIDMSQVEHIVLPSAGRVRDLADLSAEMDPPASAPRLAIVAPEAFAFGLARMYKAYRDTNRLSTRQVAVFRSLADARKWLGIEEPDSGPEALTGHSR